MFIRHIITFLKKHFGFQLDCISIGSRFFLGPWMEDIMQNPYIYIYIYIINYHDIEDF